MNAYGVGRRPGLGGLAAVRGWLAGVAAIVVAGAALAQAPNQIEQVSVTRAASGNTIVRFELKSPPANPPAGFATASPPRIALDFFDTTSALPSNQRGACDGNGASHFLPFAAFVSARCFAISSSSR